MPHVLDGHEVAALVGLALGLPRGIGHLRVAKLLVAFRIGLNLIAEIGARGFDAVVEGVPPKVVVELRRWGVPAALLLVAGLALVGVLAIGLARVLAALLIRVLATLVRVLARLVAGLGVLRVRGAEWKRQQQGDGI